MAEHEAIITQMLTDYMHDFGRLDPKVVAPYFHQPCMIDTRQGLVVATSRSELAELLGPMMEHLKGRDYTRTAWVRQHVKLLSDNTALASNVAVRYKTDGSELERIGVTYVLRKADEGWKIALLIGHASDTVVPLD